MGLVVAADDPATRGKREDAVGRSIDMQAVTRFDREATGEEDVVRAEQRSSPHPLEFGHALISGPLILDRLGDRGFGP